ncbi:MAG: hypothetical protein ABIQ33_13325 [Caldimonas sp.]
MREVVEIARTMGPEQLVLALVFLASYALALGEFATARGRVWSMGTGIVAAAGFAAFSRPWEGGVVLVGFASVGMALFTAAVWALSLATMSRAPRAAPQASATNLPRTSAAPSSRSVNIAPILNSPAAE